MNTKPSDVAFCGVRENKIKSAHPKLNTRNLVTLYQYIVRRYNIHLRKDVLGNPGPWTKDDILREYRFTNIRREHDKETKWLIEHIANNKELPYVDKLLNCILFRLYNKHETSELLSQPIRFSEFEDWDPEWYRPLFEAAVSEDKNRVFFTGAFITGGLKRALKGYLPKDDPKNSMEMRMLWFMKALIDDGVVEKIRQAESQKEVFNTLCSYDGLGSFLSYQIYVDMTYIANFPFSENEFTIAGPGCRSGLDKLFNDKDGMTYEECLFWLRDNLEFEFSRRIGKDFNPKELFWDLPESDRCLNVMCLENVFCEFSKYLRAKNGTGRPRKKYKGD